MIPVITDQMLEKILVQTSWPILVAFVACPARILETHELRRRKLFRVHLGRAWERHESDCLFFKILADENPTAVDQFRATACVDYPFVVSFKDGKPVQWAAGAFDHLIEEAIQSALEA